MSGSVASGAYSGPPTINGITEVDADVLVITEGGSLSYPDYPNTVLVVETDGTVVGVSEIDESQVPTTLRSTTFPSVVVVGGVSAASATVGSLTVTGVATIGTLSTTSLALSGTLSVAGATTLAACSVSSLACSGAATIQGFTTVNDDLLVTGDVGARDGYFMTVQADDFIAGNNSSLAITSVTTFTATGPATMAAITCTDFTASGRIYSNYAAASQMVFTPGTAASTFLRVEGPAGGVNRRITFPDPGAADREVLYTNKAQTATLGVLTIDGAAATPQLQIPGSGVAAATQELWFGLDAAGETQWRLLGANSTFGSNWRVRSRLGGVTSDKLVVAASGTSIWSNLGVGKAPTANALDVLGATVLQGLTCTTLTTSSDGVIGGNLSVTGTVTFAAMTVASLNCTGNAVVGGTLGVTGDCSTSGTFLGSAVDVAGNADVGADLTVSGATTLASALMTSLICTGTASVTGNATLSANVGIGAAPNASYRLYVTGNPTNLTRSAVVPTFSVRVLNVADTNTVAWAQNGDPTDSGRIMQVYNGSTSTSAGIQSVLSFHIIGGGTASRVLSDLKMIRETSTQGNGAFVLTGRTSGASIVMRDYAYLGWSKAYISPGAGNPVTLASQTAPTAGYYVAMGTAGGTTDGHTEVNGNLLVRGTATVSGATTLAAITCSSLTCSGNATVGGTLGVTGALTASGSVSLGNSITSDYLDVGATQRVQLSEDGAAQNGVPRVYPSIAWCKNMDANWPAGYIYIALRIPITYDANTLDDLRRCGGMVRVSATMSQYNTGNHGTYTATVSLSLLSSNVLDYFVTESSTNDGMPGTFNFQVNSWRVRQKAGLDPSAFWLVFTHGVTITNNLGCRIIADLVFPSRSTGAPYWEYTDNLTDTSTTVVP